MKYWKAHINERANDESEVEDEEEVRTEEESKCSTRDRHGEWLNGLTFDAPYDVLLKNTDLFLPRHKLCVNTSYKIFIFANIHNICLSPRITVRPSPLDLLLMQMVLRIHRIEMNSLEY